MKVSMKETLAEDKIRRQNAMNVMMDSLKPLDLSKLDLLEVTLNLFAHAVVQLGADDEVALTAAAACLAELRARKATETNTTLN